MTSLVTYLVMAYLVMAYLVMAYGVMAYVVMAYLVIAYLVMACIRFGDEPGAMLHRPALGIRRDGHRLLRHIRRSTDLFLALFGACRRRTPRG